MHPQVFPVRSPQARIARGSFYERRPGHRHGIHGGVDIPAPAGAPIVAATSGRVVKIYRHNRPPLGGADSDSARAVGNGVALRDGDGVTHIYAHMRDLPLVSPGQVVQTGTQLGVVGSTGRSNGPHLHYQMERGGERIDPTDALQRAQAAYAATDHRHDPDIGLGSPEAEQEMNEDAREWYRRMQPTTDRLIEEQGSQFWRVVHEVVDAQRAEELERTRRMMMPIVLDLRRRASSHAARGEWRQAADALHGATVTLSSFLSPMRGVLADAPAVFQPLLAPLTTANSMLDTYTEVTRRAANLAAEAADDTHEAYRGAVDSMSGIGAGFLLILGYGLLQSFGGRR